MVSCVKEEAAFFFTSVAFTWYLKGNQKTWHQEATQESDIPTKITKQFPCLSVDFLSKNIVLLKVFFAMIFKKVHPTHIKDRKTEKFNYRIASILPNLSSLYERSSW